MIRLSSSILFASGRIFEFNGFTQFQWVVRLEDINCEICLDNLINFDSMIGGRYYEGIVKRILDKLPYAPSGF